MTTFVGVYLYRYARDMADLRRQEQEYADAIQAKWQARQHDHTDYRRPE